MSEKYKYYYCSYRYFTNYNTNGFGMAIRRLTMPIKTLYTTITNDIEREENYKSVYILHLAEITKEDANP